MDDPDVVERLVEVLKATNYWIHNLKVGSMKCSLNMNIITLYLPLLTSLELGYGVKHAGFLLFIIINNRNWLLLFNKGFTNFQKNLFGMKLSEAAILGESIKENCKNLVIFIDNYLKIIKIPFEI